MSVFSAVKSTVLKNSKIHRDKFKDSQNMILFIYTGSNCCGNSEKMDQLQLPEGFRPDFQPKYVSYIYKQIIFCCGNIRQKQGTVMFCGASLKKWGKAF